jgi:hypothetical protein
MNPDTLVIHADRPKCQAKCQAVIDALQPYAKVDEPTTVTVNGITMTTYPERSKGHWLAFHVPMTPTKDSTQAVPLEFRIYTQPIAPKSNMWPVEITLHSTILWVFPFQEIWITILATLRRLTRDAEEWQFRLSRVDMAIDTDELDLAHLDEAEFVTRAHRRAKYTQQYNEQDSDTVDALDEESLFTTSPGMVFTHGQVTTGYRFGKGRLLVRIYNKWEEISARVSYKQDKRFFAQLWQSHGWDMTRDVWRIEVQLRREILHELITEDGEILSAMRIPHAIQTLPGFLPYFLIEWLSLREKSPHAKPSRWPLHPEWTRIIATAAESAPAGQRFYLPPAFNAQKLAQTILGYLSSFALAAETWNDDFFPTLPVLLGEALGLSPAGVIATLETAIRKKAEKYHMALPGTLTDDAAWQEVAITMDEEALLHEFECESSAKYTG